MNYASLFAKAGLMNFVWVLVGVTGLIILLFKLKPRAGFGRRNIRRHAFTNPPLPTRIAASSLCRCDGVRRVWGVKHFLLMIGMVSCESALAAPKPAKTFVNTLGMKFVPVPGTKVQFYILETREKDYSAYAADNVGVMRNEELVRFV